MDQVGIPFHVDTYDSPEGAEAGAKVLHAAGIDVTRLSIGVKGSQLERHAAGFDASAGMLFLGHRGAIWGALWGPDLGHALFLLPETGPLVVIGKQAGCIASAINGSALGGTAGVIAVALISVGVPEHSVPKYDGEMKVGRFLVLAHGSASPTKPARGEISHGPGIPSPQEESW